MCLFTLRSAGSVALCWYAMKKPCSPSTLVAHVTSSKTVG